VASSNGGMIQMTLTSKWRKCKTQTKTVKYCNKKYILIKFIL
jgi:hypothetical protein